MCDTGTEQGKENDIAARAECPAFRLACAILSSRF